MNEEATAHSSYIGIFVVLVAALVLSLGLGLLHPSPTVVMAIFAIAAFKAYLVLSRFMHLAYEPKFIKVIVTSLFILLAVLWIGLVPDIVYVFGGPEDLR